MLVQTAKLGPEVRYIKAGRAHLQVCRSFSRSWDSGLPQCIVSPCHSFRRQHTTGTPQAHSWRGVDAQQGRLTSASFRPAMEVASGIVAISVDGAKGSKRKRNRLKLSCVCPPPPPSLLTGLQAKQRVPLLLLLLHVPLFCWQPGADAGICLLRTSARDRYRARRGRRGVIRKSLAVPASVSGSLLSEALPAKSDVANRSFLFRVCSRLVFLTERQVEHECCKRSA